MVASAFDALDGLDDDAGTSRHASAPRRDPCGHERRAAGRSHDSACAVITPVAARFIEKLKTKRLWDHNRFINALNPSMRSHDASLRTAYAALSEADQQSLWYAIPHAHGSPAVASPPVATGAMPSRKGGDKVAPAAARGRRRARPHGGLSWSPEAGERSLSPEDCGAQLQVTEAALTEAEKRERESSVCVVCMERSRDALLMPCRHKVLCMMCAFQVQDCSGECPYCRQVIEEVMHLQ